MLYSDSKINHYIQINKYYIMALIEKGQVELLYLYIYFYIIDHSTFFCLFNEIVIPLPSSSHQFHPLNDRLVIWGVNSEFRQKPLGREPSGYIVTSCFREEPGISRQEKLVIKMHTWCITGCYYKLTCPGQEKITKGQPMILLAQCA